MQRAAVNSALTRSDLIAELAASHPQLRVADIELIVSTVFVVRGWSCAASAPSPSNGATRGRGVILGPGRRWRWRRRRWDPSSGSILLVRTVKPDDPGELRKTPSTMGESHEANAIFPGCVPSRLARHGVSPPRRRGHCLTALYRGQRARREVECVGINAHCRATRCGAQGTNRAPEGSARPTRQRRPIREGD